MGVSESRGTPKSSIFIGISIINHPFWGIPIFGNTHLMKIVHFHKQSTSKENIPSEHAVLELPKTQAAGVFMLVNLETSP